MTLLEVKDVLQIDATVLAGAFIFFTLSSLFGGRFLGLRLVSKDFGFLERVAAPNLIARGYEPDVIRHTLDVFKSNLMDENKEVNLFASNYTAFSVMLPFAASACVAILQTWFNEDYFMSISEILMFIGFIAVVLLRQIYDILAKYKRTKLNPPSAKLKTGK